MPLLSSSQPTDSDFGSRGGCAHSPMPSTATWRSGRDAVPRTRSTRCAAGVPGVPRLAARRAPRRRLGHRDPLRPGTPGVNRSCHSGRDSTRTSAKPAEPSVSAQSMRMRRGSCESTGLRGSQFGQHQAAARPEQPPCLAGRRRRIGGKVQGVNGDDGVDGSISQAGAGEVADHEPCLVASPNSAARSVACWTATAEKSTPISMAPCDWASHSPGPPRPQPRSTSVFPGERARASATWPSRATDTKE
jgi:hypothetical protein